jgi:hypothetical protein
VPPPIDSARLRPRSWWYATAAIPGLLGVAGLALCIVFAIDAFPGDPAPFTAPGSKVLRLDAGQEQTIYRHTRGAGVASQAGTPVCHVRNVRNEREVPLDRTGSTTYTINDDSYVSEYDFDPPTAGEYRVSCRPTQDVAGQPLAVGDRGNFGLFGGLIAGAIASFVLGLMLAGGVIALVAVLRHRHKRRLQQEAQGRPAS